MWRIWPVFITWKRQWLQVGEHELIWCLFSKFKPFQLSLDWCNSTIYTIRVTISVSGRFVYLLRLGENGRLLDQKWNAHNFDAWITAYDRWNKHVVYSGGEWRLFTRHPWKDQYLLAACCHSGFHVLKFATKSPDKAEVVASYTEHEPLAYGADWGSRRCSSGDNHGGLHEVMATCSLYDHRFDLWCL